MENSQSFRKNPTASLVRAVILGSGTSTGVPVIGCRCAVCQSPDSRNKRLRSSLLLEGEHTRLVIDTGPDFRQQILGQNSPVIDGILYTHTHADHVQGFDDLRGLYFQTGKPVACYLARDFAAELKTRFSYAFTETGYSGAKPNIAMNVIPDEGSFQVGDLTVETVRVPHGHVTTSVFKVGDFLYATDFKTFPSDLIEKWRGKIHTMIASGIYFGHHDAHSTIEETVQLMETLKVKRGIITHISHRVDHREDAEKLPPFVSFAYDGMIIPFP